jgi:TolA-binding protein
MRAISKKVGGSLVIRGIIALSLLAIFVLPAYAAPPPPKKKAPPAGQDLYGSVWQKVRPNPKARPTGTASAVAGLRGEEKGKFLKPYWKGEKKIETPDLLAFREIGKLMDAQDFAKAEQAFLNFITSYPKSALMPKIKLGLAICFIHLGKKDDAVKVLTDWLAQYPQNELAPDVKNILADIKK